MNNAIYADAIMNAIAMIGSAFILTNLFYEWISGKFQAGKKTKEDWFASTLGLVSLSLFQRPFLFVMIFGLGISLVPEYAGSLRWLEQNYFWPCLILWVFIDELFHGYAHRLAHIATPNNRIAAAIQKFYKKAHRIHHLSGGNDGKGELNVMQTFTISWCWYIILPNYALGMIILYLGFYETFFWTFLLKNLWAMQVHTNWSYDLYLLNHRWQWVRKSMYALCHIIVFPTMHHQHHSRSHNSAKNMQTFLAVYDWLLWKTLVIETQRPQQYGWRQYPKEEFNIFHRWLALSPK